MNLSLPVITIILPVFALFIFVAFLLHKGRNNPSNWWLMLFFISQAIGALATFPLIYPESFFPHYALPVFLVCTFALLWGPSFFLYINSICQPVQPKIWMKLLHFIPFLFYNLYFVFIHPDLDTLVSFLSYIIDLQVLGYILASIWEYYKLKRNEKIYQSLQANDMLKWLQYVVFGYLTTCTVDDVFIRFFVNVPSISSYALSSIPFSIYLTGLLYKGLLHQQVFINKKKYTSSSLTQANAKSIQKMLLDYIEAEKPHLNSELTIKELAESIEISERHLSQIINEYKQQHFYDFINSYRIEDAKHMLLDANSTKNITQIMYDAGFNSKTAFNKAFRKFTGTTPSQFKKNGIVSQQ